MGIDKQSDIAANIQIGPTDQGMVRIYIEAEGGVNLPLDFDPEGTDAVPRLFEKLAMSAAQEPNPERQTGGGGEFEILAHFPAQRG